MTKKQLLIDATNKITSQYTTRLTLRQIYYRLVASQVIENKQSEYKYLSKVLTEARLEKKVPFANIEDRTRVPDVEYCNYWTAREWLVGMIKDAYNSILGYSIPKWYKQTTFVEVWVEKDALRGLFREVCRELEVTLVTCKGYPSITLLKESADRIKRERRSRAVDKLVILYFGDYDPSGRDIPRNVEERLKTDFHINFELDLIALTEEQILEYNLPPVPAKKSDSRTANFISEHGDQAVELDAIEPDVLQDLIRDAISKHYDDDKWDDEILPMEEEAQAELEEEVERLFADLMDEIKEG